MKRKARPRVLVLAGFEPSGAAGLLADLWAIERSGGVGVAIPTALTAQGPGTFLVRPVPLEVIRSQVRAALGGKTFDAVKLGMIPNSKMLQELVRLLRPLGPIPWVVDPVVRTSRGEPLSSLQPRHFARLATAQVVLTPNQPEATWLLGKKGADSASALQARGYRGVVVKGGHSAGAPTDVVATARGLTHLRGSRIRCAASTRGTGCRFAAALAVELGRGRQLEDAARRAKAVVRGYLRASG